MEIIQKATSWLVPVMQGGRRLLSAEPLERSRQRALEQLKRLPESLKSLETASPYLMTLSAALKTLALEVDMRQAHAPRVI